MLVQSFLVLVPRRTSDPGGLLAAQPAKAPPLAMLVLFIVHIGC